MGAGRTRARQTSDVLQHLFHAWERRLADATKDRVVRPFEWGLDWIPRNGSAPGAAPRDVVRAWVERVMADTDAFYSAPPTTDYTLAGSEEGGQLTFPSAYVTPHVENNTVRCRYFVARSARLKSTRYEEGIGSARLKASRDDEGIGTARLKTLRDDERIGTARLKTSRHDESSVSDESLDRADANARSASLSGERRRAAVLVLPQWNSDANGHVGLCRLIAMSGMSALRLSLPYHDERMPPELHRADYIVSANIARTLQVCRQAVLDARRAIQWLAMRGYDRIGILGSSLGSCLSLLTTAHEPLIRAQALNHISPWFADVVWRGLSTRHVRQGLDGHIDLDLLRTLWAPISPQMFLERVRDRQTLLVYARYDLTFPVDLSEDLVNAFKDGAIPHDVAALRCGHYSIGKTPFKYLDGWILIRFLKRALST